MSILHTINKSPFTHNTLMSCIAVCADNDGILLIEDGVFGAIQGVPGEQKLLLLNQQGIPIYALSHDIKARALEQKIANYIQLVTYDDFVRLTLQFNCIQSWY